MWRVIVFVFILLKANLVFAQQLLIKDAQTSDPIESAIVISESPRLLTVTNSLGKADISLYQSIEKIIIQRLGYQAQTFSFSQLKENDFQIYLQPLPSKFQELVVSATRWNQSALYVPSKISGISKEDVAFYNPQTAADLLGSSGEVFIQKSQQGGGSPMIRGFSTNRLLYSVDGVRMNTAIFRSGNIQNVISLDAFAIENTEILFGPGSVIYGSDAVGGVMSFQTLKPEFSDEDKLKVSGNVLSRFSTANRETTQHADIKIGGKKWASASSVSYSNFNDLKMGKHGPEEYLRKQFVKQVDGEDQLIENTNPKIQTPSGYAQLNLMQKLRFQAHKNWDLEYAFHLSQTSDFARYDRLIEILPDGRPRSAVWNYGPQKWRMHHFNATHTAFGKLYDRMSIRMARQYFEESRIDRNFTGSERFRLRTQLEEVQAYSVNLDLEKAKSRHHWYYGLEYVLNDVRSTGTALDIRDGSSIAVPDRYPQSQWSSYAAYLNYQFFLSDKLALQTGVRYGVFVIDSDFSRHLSFFPFDFTASRVQNAATTGSLGMVFRPESSWKISANLSTGFRAPNVDDIGKIFDFAAGEVVVPNASLQAEYAYNAELNLSKYFGDRLKLDLTGFYTFLDGAMVRRAFQVNGQDSIMFNGELSRVFAIQNAAFGTVYGFHAGFDLQLPEGFSFGSRYNYQLGVEEMDNGEVSRSRHAAPAFGRSTLNFQYRKLHLQLYAHYSAEVSFANLNEEERQKPAIYAIDANGNPFSPAWYTLNLKMSFDLHPNMVMNAGLENITDQRYRPYSSGLVAPGRNVVISLRGRF